MKKFFTSAVMAVLPLLPVSTFADNITTPLFATFEDGTSVPFTLNADGPGSEIKTQVVDNNPSKTVNTSDKCIRVDKSASYDWFFKTYFKVQDGTTILPASANHKYLHFYVKYPGGGTGVEIAVFKVGDTTTPIYQGQVDFASTDGWQDVVADLSGKLDDGGIGGIWIRPFYGSGNTCYFDQFELSDSADPRVMKTLWNSSTLATFETGEETPYAFTVDGAPTDAAKDNPNTTGINNTAKCLFGDYSGGMDWWYKVKLDAKQDYAVVPNSANHKYLHFLACRSVIARSEVQVNHGDTRIYQRQFTNSTVNTWEEIVVDLTDSEADLSGITGETIDNIWIMTSLDGAAGSFYYDSFVLSDSKDPIGLVRNLTDLGNFETDYNQPIMASAVQTTGASAVIDANPLLSDELNTTSKAIKYVRPAGAEWWQSLQLFADGFAGVASPNVYLHFMMYNPANQKISVVINNIAGEAFEKEIIPTQNTAWEDYVIDLSAFSAPVLNNIRSINFRMPEDAAENAYYFDEFILSDQSAPRTAGSQTKIEKTTVEDFRYTINNGEIRIEGADIVSAEAYGINGILLQSKPADSASSIALTLAKGAYIVKVATKDGKTIIRKVVL